MSWDFDSGELSPLESTVEGAEPDRSSIDAPLLSLDLGSGTRPAAGYTGVDVCDGEGIVHCDLWSGVPWPFADGSVERLRAWHVIEHIPHDRIRVGVGRAKSTSKRPGQPPVLTHKSYPITQDAFFWFFDQAWRIAAPGCRFELAWPDPQHEHADQDPTHCRRVTPCSLQYLSREGRRIMGVTQYVVACDWRVEGAVMRIGSEEALAPYTDVAEAARHWGATHEIRAILVKP